MIGLAVPVSANPITIGSQANYSQNSPRQTSGGLGDQAVALFAVSIYSLNTKHDQILILPVMPHAGWPLPLCLLCSQLTGGRQSSEITSVPPPEKPKTL